MKLKSLKIQDFCGIQSADVDLSAPVTVILGDNGASKSSIKDAIQFVFSGGLCENRGYTKKNQAGMLQNDDGTKLLVELEAVCGTYKRTATTGTTPPINPDMSTIAINPQSVLTMKPRDRQGVFGKLLSDDSTVKEIQEKIWAMNFSYKITTIADLDGIQKSTVGARQEAKRVIIALTDEHKDKPAASIDIVGTPFDLTKQQLDKLKNLFNDRTNERDGLNRRIGAYQSDLEGVDRSMSVADLKAKKTKLQKRRQLLVDTLEALKQDRTKLQCNLNAAGELLRTRQAGLDKHKAQRDQNQILLNQIKAIRGKCPFCTHTLTGKTLKQIVDKISSEIAELDAGIKLAEADLKEPRTKHTNLQKEVYRMAQTDSGVVIDLSEVENELEDIDARIIRVGKVPVIENELKVCQEKLTDILLRIVNLSNLIEAKTKYDTYNETYEASIQQIREQRTIIDNMNKLDEALKPDGELRKIANKSMESAAFDMELAKAWGMESLKLEPDGTITLFGRPVEAASDSEKYRAGVLLAELLSRSIKLGILVLDGLEILSDTTRAALNDRLLHWNHFKNIILLRTVSQRPKELPKAGWIKCYWVENGTVEQLIDKQQAVA